VLGVLALVLVPGCAPSTSSVALLIAAAASTVIGLSRLYLGVHWAATSSWLAHRRMWLAVCFTRPDCGRCVDRRGESSLNPHPTGRGV